LKRPIRGGARDRKGGEPRRKRYIAVKEGKKKNHGQVKQNRSKPGGREELQMECVFGGGGGGLFT